MNMQDLSIAFGERTGKDVTPDQLRMQGNWVFYHDPKYPDEAECYYREDCICWEPWTDIPIEKSPFKPNNDHIVEQTLIELDTKYNMSV